MRAERIREDAGFADRDVGVELGAIIWAGISTNHHCGGIALRLLDIAGGAGVLGDLLAVNVKLILVAIEYADRVVPLARLHFLLGFLITAVSINGKGQLVTIDDHGPTAGFFISAQALFVAVKIAVIAEDALHGEAVFYLVKLISDIEADSILAAVEMSDRALKHAVLFHRGRTDG